MQRRRTLCPPLLFVSSASAPEASEAACCTRVADDILIYRTACAPRRGAGCTVAPLMRPTRQPTSAPPSTAAPARRAGAAVLALVLMVYAIAGMQQLSWASAENPPTGRVGRGRRTRPRVRRKRRPGERRGAAEPARADAFRRRIARGRRARRGGQPSRRDHRLVSAVRN